MRSTETERQLPSSPERFEDYTTVSGCTGFNSGTGCSGVGVIEESVQRRGGEIWLHDGKYTAYAPSYTDRVLSFFDSDTNTNIYVHFLTDFH